MEAWFYREIDAEARRWWYHKELRTAGNVAEARKRERQSIKSGLQQYRDLIENRGVCTISADGDVSLNLRNGSRVSGCGLATAELCKRLGIIVKDCRTAEWQKVLAVTLRGPMVVDHVQKAWTPAGERVTYPQPDPQPWNSMSYVSLDVYLAGYQEAGCTIHNWTRPDGVEAYQIPPRAPAHGEPPRPEYDEVYLGPTPYESECQQAPYERPDLARLECRCFIEQLRRQFGEEPEGATIKIKSNPHDFGSYLDVVVRFDMNNEAARDYAYRVENNVPARWDGEAIEKMPHLFEPQRREA